MPPRRRPGASPSAGTSNGKPQTSTSHKRSRLLAGRQINGGSGGSGGGKGKGKQARPPSTVAAGRGSMLAVSSAAGLPGAVDVEKFALARSFEVEAMKTAMKTAFDSSTKRAFQTLPRHLRRRAASHNARRVPGRLRAKAASEIDPKTAPEPKHYPKRKISMKTGLTRTAKLRRRQKTKAWLETHIWMAKRMHMINIWGFRLAHRPTEKAFRPSHRAAIHGAILTDVSYFSLLELEGEEPVLERVLRRVSAEVCWGNRYSPGSRQATTTLHLPSAYPLGLLCPATVLWCPHPSSPSNSIDANSASSSTVPEPRRQVWIRFHPGSHAEVWGALRASIGATLEEIRAERAFIPGNCDTAAQGKGKGRGGTEQETTVGLSDIRQTVNAFEFIGPKAARVLKGALGGLVRSEDRAEMKEIWANFADVRTAGALPEGMVLGMKIYDPRLSYPPTNPKDVTATDSGQTPAWTHQPSPTLARNELWDGELRRTISRKQFKKVELDQRRHKFGQPGKPLRALAQDARVPLMLVQTSLAPPDGSPSSSHYAQHGFTLFLPAGWAQAFLSSLVFTGTRVGGLRERQARAFESGAGSFPEDWAGTRASGRWWDEQEQGRKERWARKPPAKRPQWMSLGWAEEGSGQPGSSPWKPDWETLVRRTLVDDEEAVALNEDTPEPWLLRLPGGLAGLLPRLLLASFIDDTGASVVFTLLETLNVLRKRRNLSPLAFGDGRRLLAGALVRVSVEMLGRGVAGEVGPIYVLDGEGEGEEEVRWREAFAGGKNGRDMDHDEEAESAYIPPPSSIVGYQTSGAFSLARGRGHGIGAICLTTLLTLMQKDFKAGRLRPVVGRGQGGETTYTSVDGELLNLVKVRARESRVPRAAVLRVLD